MKRKPNLILEFTEFNNQRMNSDSVQASTHVDDAQLSADAFDKHQDLIRQANARLNSIMGGVMNTQSWAALRKAMMSDRQEISALKILRILPNNAGDWDVYIEFIIDENDYWGVIRNITTRDASLTSEVFKDQNNLHITKEWIIRTKGIILKTIKKFLTPVAGEWRSLKEIIAIDINTGEEKILSSGTAIKLERAFDNRIVFSISNKYYQLVGSNWIYFNWWFEKIDD
jgi:hypothetical protein